jgi:DNA-binding IclR family transcriptional regulator
MNALDDGKLTVRAVERALDILLCFTDSSDLSLTEIARRVSLHKSTAHRLLASLESKGFVLRDPGTERYRLGYRVWELSANLTQSDEPALILLPEMERLRDLVGETISLYVRDGHERIRIQAVQSSHSVRRVAPVGERMPLYVGASSKVLVAYEDEEFLRELLDSPHCPDYIDKRAFVRQMGDIRRAGYATSFEEREPGANAFAAPIFNRAGKLVAALAVSGPANRWTPEAMNRFAPQIIAFAQRMGKMLK